jgi:F-type H+-transporting ATPase subunit b
VNITATLFGQMLVFVVLILFIKAVLWGPMLKMLENRKARIADGLAAAERGKHEQEMAEEKAKGVLRDAKHQAADIITQAQRRAGEIVDEAKQAAREESERIKIAAQAEIEQESNRAREQLRREVSNIALLAASKVIKKEVDAKVHGAVLDEMAAQI